MSRTTPMRCLKQAGKRGLLGLCLAIGISVCSDVRGTSVADAEQGASESRPIGCDRGHDIRPGDTCAWTIEGDEVEIHAAPDGCVQVILRKAGQGNPESGPRLCPGGPAYAEGGLPEGDVGDTVVASATEAPICGVISISGLSLDFNGADIRIGAGLDLDRLVVHWSGARWFVKEAPSREWIDPRRVDEAPACHPGRRLGPNHLCRHGEHVAVIGRRGNRVDVWENGKDQPERWVVDPDASCYVMASMSARAFSSLAFAGLQLVWDGDDRTWTVVAP